MPKRAGNLFPKLVSDENLRLAIKEVNATHHFRGRHKPNACTAWVEETAEARVAELRQIIQAGFEPKPPNTKRRWDASARKWRTIHEPAQWPDQYVHHALIQVLQPAMMRGMDPYCCGSIRGRGVRHAKEAVERWVRGDRKGTKYELQADIYHFYDTLKPEIVMDRMRSLIKDRLVLDLIRRIVKDGVMIGYYTSQWFANTVLQPLDQIIRQSGLCAHYVRYMDNITIFGQNKRKLRRLKDLVGSWLTARGMRLKGDWQIFPVRARLPTAVGYRYGRTYTIPHKHNFLRTKRAVAKYRKRNGRVSERTANGIISRCGQLKHCSNVNLYRILFRGERILRGCKNIIRSARRKETLTWNTYLAQRATRRSSKSSPTPTPA